MHSSPILYLVNAEISRNSDPIIMTFLAERIYGTTPYSGFLLDIRNQADQRIRSVIKSINSTVGKSHVKRFAIRSAISFPFQTFVTQSDRFLCSSPQITEMYPTYVFGFCCTFEMINCLSQAGNWILGK
jgi:hypothetical protein